MTLYMTRINLFIYLYINLFMHINLRNHISCIHLFICVRFIYLRIRGLCNDYNFIYFLFIYIFMFMDLCTYDLCNNNVSFICL